MLRSFLNSVRGRSAIASPPYHLDGPSWTPVAYRSWELNTATVTSAPAEDPSTESLPPVTASASNTRPERCCVYCGHAIYAPPRVPRLRCPKCFADILVQDVTLTGEVAEAQIVTAGKIVVAESAQVAANLIACRVEIAGRVLGDVLASNTCTVRETGKQAGRILCRRLELHPGAEIEGSVELIQN